MKHNYCSIFLFVGLLGCGSEFLECGTYKVESIYIKDDWPHSLKGNHYKMKWDFELTENNNYKITINGRSTINNINDGSIVLYNHGDKKTNCEYYRWEYSRFLTPNDDAKSFVGYANNITFFCVDGELTNVLVAELKFTGKKI